MTTRVRAGDRRPRPAPQRLADTARTASRSHIGPTLPGSPPAPRSIQCVARRTANRPTRLPPRPCSDRFRAPLLPGTQPMSLTAERLDRIQPSLTIAISTKARHMIAEGKNVISLSQGEPDFDTPRNVKDAAIRAIESGETQLHRRRRHAGAAQGGGGEVQARQRHRLQAGGDHHLHRRQAGDLQRHAGDAQRGRRGDHPQPVLGQLSRHRHAWPTASRCWCRAARTTASSCAPRIWKRRSRRAPTGSC